jgi:hypothetical protein
MNLGHFAGIPASSCSRVATGTFRYNPRLSETLLFLVRNGEKLSRKEDLLNTVWPDAFVEGIQSHPESLSFARRSATRTATATTSLRCRVEATGLRKRNISFRLQNSKSRQLL